MTDPITRPMFSEFDKALRGCSYVGDLTHDNGVPYTSHERKRLEDRRMQVISTLRLGARFYLESPDELFDHSAPDVPEIKSPYPMVALNYNFTSSSESVLVVISDMGQISDKYGDRSYTPEHRNYEALQRSFEDRLISVQSTHLKSNGYEYELFLPSCTLYMKPESLVSDNPNFWVAPADWVTDEEAEDPTRQKYNASVASTAFAFLYAMNQPRRAVKKRGYSGKVKHKHIKDLNRDMKFSYRMVDLSRVKKGEPFKRPAFSGVKRREHEVRGFWRTLNTGKKVWVRSHKRGDSSIGVIAKDYKNTPTMEEA